MAPIITNVLPSWVVMLAGAVAVALFAPQESHVQGLVAVLAAAIVVAFVLQIAVYRGEGLVSRLSLALTGNVFITAVVAIVFQVLAQLE
jgi:preprotein translocase subunit SecD